MKYFFSFIIFSSFCANIFAQSIEKPGDYAFIQTIIVENTSPLVVLNLPKDFYINSRSSKFEDLRIFNKEGETLSFGNVPRYVTNKTTTEIIKTKIQPIWQNINQNVGKTSSQTTNINITVDSGLANKNKVSQQNQLSSDVSENIVKDNKNVVGNTTLKEKKLAFYIGEIFPDKTAIPKNFGGITAIYLIPKGSPENYAKRITIEVSNDRSNWVKLIDSDIYFVSERDYDGDGYRININKDSDKPYRYLRAFWDNSQDSAQIEIAEINVEILLNIYHHVVYTENFIAQVIKNPQQNPIIDDRDLIYKVYPAIKPQSVNLQIPENSQLTASLGFYYTREIAGKTAYRLTGNKVSRASDKAIYNNDNAQKYFNAFIESENFYYLKKENDWVLNKPIFNNEQNSLWVVRQESPAVNYRNLIMPENQLPQLVLQWEANPIFFIARGSPPYTLAYGKVVSGEYPQKSIAVYPNDISSEIVWASLGEVKKNINIDLDKEESLIQESQKKNTTIFWLILLLGVILMSFIAFILFRENRNSARSES